MFRLENISLLRSNLHSAIKNFLFDFPISLWHKRWAKNEIFATINHKWFGGLWHRRFCYANWYHRWNIGWKLILFSFQLYPNRHKSLEFIFTLYIHKIFFRWWLYFDRINWMNSFLLFLFYFSKAKNFYVTIFFCFYRLQRPRLSSHWI